VNPQASQFPQYALLELAFTAIDGLVMLDYACSGARAAQLQCSSQSRDKTFSQRLA
jgi:hypothetical protein